MKKNELKTELAAAQSALTLLADRLALAEINAEESRLTIGELWERFASPDDTPHDSESVAKGLRFLQRYGIADACIFDGFLHYSSWGMWFVPAEGDDEGSAGAVHIGHWTNQRVRIVFVGPVKESAE